MKEFDPASIDSPSDVAYKFAEAHERVTELSEKIRKLEHELSHADEVLATLDRWMLAIFEANPQKQSIRISYRYKELTLSPGPDGFVLIGEQYLPSSLNMVPLPMEPDFDDDDIDCGVPTTHPFDFNATLSRLIGDIFNDDDHPVS
jgi:hypothetical protein